MRRVELRDFRSYGEASVDLPAGVALLLGPNAQGKTNLVEALHRVATGSSHRVTSDGPLVRAGADAAYVRALLATDAGRSRTLELELSPGRGSRTRVDGNDVRRASEAVGVLRVVLFAPEDVAVVRGDPAVRRGLLDTLLAQRRPSYAAARAEFERALRQRNHLLKQVRGLAPAAASAARPTLDTWTDQLVGYGTALLAARIAGVHALAGPADGFYRRLADRPEPVELTYRSSIGQRFTATPGGGIPEPGPLQEAFRQALARVDGEEVARGLTLVGPHRDDLELTVGGLAARTHASHGEAWSLALALKLATYDVLAEVGERPVVLLDDVFAELDQTRRRRLAEACGAWDQVVVTAAVEADVPLGGQRLDITLENGTSVVRPRAAVADGAA